MTGTQPARGMRDFLPEDVRRRQYVIGVIADVYQRYGFEPLETPAVENIETLLGKYGEEGDKLIFKILKRGEGAETGQADLALRYDLTVPLARVVAEYRAKLPKFFKRYQVQPVWRADRPQKGRFREFYQCDVDAIGSTSMAVEAELLAAASDVLLELGFRDFRIHLNHRQVLNGVLKSHAVQPDQFASALAEIDKYDKVGHEGVREGLRAKGLPNMVADELLRTLYGAASDDEPLRNDQSNARAIQRLRNLNFVPDIAQGLSELERLLEYSSSGSAADHIVLDLTLARGLSYYTGAIFEIRVPDLAGSLGGGGRYDNLIGMFLGHEVPACGISLGLERILVVMGERDMFKDLAVPAGAADVLVTLWNNERASESLAIAAELRATGLRVEVYPDADKLGKQFKYASERKIPFVVVAGDDELARGAVAVKSLASGEQTTVARAEAAAFIKGRQA